MGKQLFYVSGLGPLAFRQVVSYNRNAFFLFLLPFTDE